jgi:hypothetical protein
MPNDDVQLESLLRQFRPMAPSPLPELNHLQPNKNTWRRQVFALAAAFLVAFGVWRITKPRLRALHPLPVSNHFTVSPNQPVTLGDLQKLTKADPDRLNLVLDSEATRLLPNIEKSRGALGVLAQQ